MDNFLNVEVKSKIFISNGNLDLRDIFQSKAYDQRLYFYVVFQPKICNIYVVEKGKICGQKSKICGPTKGLKSLVKQRKMVSDGLKEQRRYFLLL